MKKILLFLMLLCSLCACQNSHRKAVKLYDKAVKLEASGNYSKAISLLKKSGKMGYGQAYNHLGEIYCDTTTFLCDSARAYKYFLKAEKMGVLEATSNRGVLLTRGFEGITPDEEEAIRLFKKAGESNTADGFHLWAYYYLERNDSARWFKLEKRGAELGSDKSYTNIGIHYYNRGDYDKALKYLTEAAEMNNKISLYNLAYYHAVPEEAEKFNIKVDINKAIDYCKRADTPQAYTLLSWIYSGHGYNDYDTSFYYAKKAAEGGDAQGQFNYAWQLYCGYGCRADKAEAKKWLRKSAAQGHEDAKKTLATI